VPAHGIALWNGSAWSPLGSGADPGFQGGSRTAYALCVYDDGNGPCLYAGGHFTHVDGKPSSNFAKWGVPCSAPTVLVDPVDVTAIYPADLTFTVTATGTADLAYQWRKDGIDLVQIPQRIEGVNTSTLRIFGWSYADTGDYDCVVGNSLGFVYSNAAHLTVPAGGVTGTPVQVTRIALEGDPMPGLSSGVDYTRLITPLLAEDGGVVFWSEGTGDIRGLSSWNAGTLALPDYTGAPAPGTGPGVVFTNSGGTVFSDFTCASGGLHSFTSRLGGPGVTSGNSLGIWHRDPSSTHLVTRLGDPSPGNPPGSYIEELHAAHTSASGLVVYMDESATSGGAYLSESLRAWDATNGAVEVFRSGDAAPGTSAHFVSFDGWQVNASGTILLKADLDDGTAGLWVGVPGAMQRAVLTSDPAPGFVAGTLITSFQGRARLNDQGEFAFLCHPTPPGGSLQRAIYRWTPAGLQAVVLQGDAAPGFAEPFQGLELFAFTDDARCLFSAAFSGNCTDCPTKALWVEDAQGLHLVAKNLPGPLPEVPAAWTLMAFTVGAINSHGEVVFGCNHSFAAGPKRRACSRSPCPGRSSRRCPATTAR
jgi:hypothetical protein